jgi:hypothetical protein
VGLLLAGITVRQHAHNSRARDQHKFIIKYPMMLLGTSVVMGAFASAYRSEEARVADPVAEQALAGD